MFLVFECLPDSDSSAGGFIYNSVAAGNGEGGIYCMLPLTRNKYTSYRAGDKNAQQRIASFIC
jgi:hypothetical protein